MSTKAYGSIGSVENGSNDADSLRLDASRERLILFRRVLIGVGLTALVGILGTAAITGDGGRSRGTIMATVLSTTASVYNITASNEYGGQPAAVANGLYLLEHQIVEPYRSTTLVVSSTKDSSTVEDWVWKIRNMKTGVIENDLAGSSVAHVFKCRGGDLFQVEVVSESLGLTVKSNFRSKYVRRELRDLKDHDAEAYLEALHTVYTVREDVGRSLYGNDFTPHHWFSRWHLGSDSMSSPWHGAPSFFGAHAYLGSKMERALQSIKPSVALHYWDFTIDAHMTETGELDSWADSFFWSSNWFGPMDSESRDDTLKRIKGRFHDVTIERNASDNFRISEQPTNSYGLITSPWNNNPAVYSTRSFSVCGISTRKMPIPGCDELKVSIANLTDMATFRFVTDTILHAQFHKVESACCLPAHLSYYNPPSLHLYRRCLEERGSVRSI